MPADKPNIVSDCDKAKAAAQPSFTAGPWEPASEEFPGDWDAHPNEGGCAEWQCIRSKGQTIAIVVRDYEHPDHISEDEFHQIVNLVSAAPDLLEALKGMADAYVALLLTKGEDPANYRSPILPYGKALAAITKAGSEG